MNAPNNRWTALDQIRALAAFLVFTWHFAHGPNGTPVPFKGAPVIPFAALFDEGHVGVALFMCLSGYLFARLLDGKRINYPAFIAARILRLLPLLIFSFLITVVIGLVKHQNMMWVAIAFIKGWVKPVWPNGGWSIAVEIHFYLILPLLLIVQRWKPIALAGFVVAAILLRCAIYMTSEQTQYFAYWTIVGRIDQFIMGICAFQYRSYLARKNWLAGACLALLAMAYYAFDEAGGFYELNKQFSAIWIILPTFEAVLLSFFIGWYDNTYSPKGKIAELIAKVGFYSFGMYLMHFFFVFKMAKVIDRYFIPLDNFYVAWLVALPCFLMMVVPAWLAYQFIEKPLQRFKPNYICKRPELVTVAGSNKEGSRLH